MNGTLHNIASTLYDAAGWLAVLAVSLAVCMVAWALVRALAPYAVGLLIRLGVIE